MKERLAAEGGRAGERELLSKRVLPGQIGNSQVLVDNER